MTNVIRDNSVRSWESADRGDTLAAQTWVAALYMLRRFLACVLLAGCAAEPPRHEGPPERPALCGVGFPCSGSCAGGYCAPACAYDDDCPGGWVCAGTNRITGETFCVVPCDTDLDCPWSSCLETRVCSLEVTPIDV